MTSSSFNPNLPSLFRARLRRALVPSLLASVAGLAAVAPLFAQGGGGTHTCTCTARADQTWNGIEITATRECPAGYRCGCDSTRNAQGKITSIWVVCLSPPPPVEG